MSNNRLRVVVKIGSSSLTDEYGNLSQEKLNDHVSEIVQLLHKGHEVAFVSSGAVAAGFHLLGFQKRPDTIEGKQAAAAIGQGMLIQAYNQAFQRYGYTVAQILLTKYDFANRKQYQNAYQTLSMLLGRGIVPIINENDTVAIDELTFGDNDRLSALVAGLIHADSLLLLTDIDGVYNSDPRKNPEAHKFSMIEEITPEIEEMVGESGSAVGTGGMKSKLSAAKLALSLGVHAYIGNANSRQSLIEILEGHGKGTYFGHSSLSGIKTRKQWIAFHSVVKGQIIIDDGAMEAMINGGKSLLPVGVLIVKGYFNRGEVVEVLSISNQLIGKGIARYTSDELMKVKGMPTDTAMKMIQVEREEVIHRDDWVTLLERSEEVLFHG